MVASAHREQVMYEYDRDAEHLRRRISRCEACRASWPCLAERGRRIAEASLARAVRA